MTRPADQGSWEMVGQRPGFGGRVYGHRHSLAVWWAGDSEGWGAGELAARPPSAASSFARLVSAAWSRAARVTATPAAVNARAVTAPIPRLAPVMIATRPARIGRAPRWNACCGVAWFVAPGGRGIDRDHWSPLRSRTLPADHRRSLPVGRRAWTDLVPASRPHEGRWVRFASVQRPGTVTSIGRRVRGESGARCIGLRRRPSCSSTDRRIPFWPAGQRGRLRPP